MKKALLDKIGWEKFGAQQKRAPIKKHCSKSMFFNHFCLAEPILRHPYLKYSNRSKVHTNVKAYSALTTPFVSQDGNHCYLHCNTLFTPITFCNYVTEPLNQKRDLKNNKTHVATRPK